MIKCKKLFVDTAPFIYLLDESDEYLEMTKNCFSDCVEKNILLCTSTITVSEYSILPYRANNIKKIEIFYEFIYDAKIRIINIDREIADFSAKLRTKNQNLKSMDALQLASAIYNNCDLFLTNDKQLKQISDIKCILPNEW